MASTEATVTTPLTSQPRRREAFPFASLRRLAPQPALGIVLGGLALLGLLAAWSHAGLTGISLTTLALAAILIAAAVLAQIHPIHVARGFKISLLTIPLYLLAALCAPTLAATGAAIALLIGELAQRQVKGQFASDIASTVGRTTVMVLVSSLAAHASYGPVTPLGGLPLLLAAGVLFLGDMLTVSLEIGAITHERPFRVVRMIVQDGGGAEATQYLIGLVGALAAQQHAWSIGLLLLPALLLRQLLKRSMELQEQTRTLLEHMADAVDLRDAYTGGHSRRVTDYTAAILQALDIRGPEAALITSAARVHDIGKIAIPDHILHKPDRLTDEERVVMESHPQRGADFLTRYPDFRRGISIVLHHHERIDGRGYPAQLSETEIPFGARVIAVADSFDAMTSDRPYRRGMDEATATRILLEGRGTQWDTAIVDAFVEQVVPGLSTQGLSPR